MRTPTPVADLFKGRQFDQEIIVLCVRWYVSYKLSSRDLVEMMAERGILLVHTTILRWVQRYVLEFEKRWSRSDTAAVTIAGIELAAKIRKVQFKVGNLSGRPVGMSAIWAAILAD